VPAAAGANFRFRVAVAPGAIDVPARPAPVIEKPVVPSARLTAEMDSGALPALPRTRATLCVPPTAGVGAGTVPPGRSAWPPDATVKPANGTPLETSRVRGMPVVLLGRLMLLR